MRKKIEINPGEKFGFLEVIGPSDRPYYYRCKCSCGQEKEVFQHSLLSGATRSCGHLFREQLKNRNETKRKENYEKAASLVGQTVRGFKIIDILPMESSGCFKYKVICPLCRKEFIAKSRSLSQIQSCKACTRKNSEAIAQISSRFSKDGSHICSVRSRLNGCTNSNSSTKANGVSYVKSQNRYRAYINFKRKQYHLGLYPSIKEAAAARRAAEERLYVPYLEHNADTEKEVRKIIDQIKKEHAQIDIEGIADAYKTDPGRSMKDIAESFGVSLLIVRRVLIGAGLYSTETSKKVCELLASGYRDDEIARLLGVSRQTVRSNYPLVEEEKESGK